MTQAGTFRFTYFTDLYEETFAFYRDLLQWELSHDWDRGAYDKGAVFHIGKGSIEFLIRPETEADHYIGLDYRRPQGVFTGIQVWNIDELYEAYKQRGVPFHHDLIDQPWGHRSFYVQEPNGLILGFYQEQF